MVESFECKACRKIFRTAEALQMHSQAKHSKPLTAKASKPLNLKKFAMPAVALVTVAIIAVIAYPTFSNYKVLPPTDIAGHVEESPSSHVLKEPMDLLVQKHMLEHADGKGLPGVVINYNCIEFSCEKDFIPKLEAFAGKYNHVYVAPFHKMSVKIALTRYGRIETLDFIDEAKIDAFIKSG